MSGRRRYREVVFDALPDTAPGIHLKTGLSRTTVFRWLRSLHEAGEIHISGWRRVEGGGPFVAVYSPGPGVDAKVKIKPLTGAQKSRRYRARARKSGAWEDHRQRERAKYWAKKTPAPDPILSVLFRKS